MIFVLGPHLPPGKGSTQAAGQVTDNTVLTAVMTPLICLILVYFAYALIVFRRRGSAIEEGAAIRGNARAQTLWIAATSAVVLFLAGYGTWALLQNGSGGGQGPTPIAVPTRPEAARAGDRPAVGVHVPLSDLRRPRDVAAHASGGRLIEFHVTSLDAVHSFWAYGLGVKADANLGTDNVVYLQTRGARSFNIHCAELCGLWHGYMFDTGRVVSTPAFAAWVKQQQSVFEAVARYMPPYRTTYAPKPQRRAG